MGACSSKPKTAEFEGSMNFYLQEEELVRKNLDDEQKGCCNAGLKSIDTEQKISSKCSLQNLRPAMENEHGSMGESEKEHLAGSSLENNEKETCARVEGTCHAKHHFVAEGVPEIGTDTSKLQKEKPSVGQELYEEPTFAQKEDVLGSRRNSILFTQVVVESPQKVAFRDEENGKFQTLENINEDKELPTFEGEKPRIDAEGGNPASCRLLQEPVFLASRVANANFNLKINPAANLTNSGTEKTAACSASRAANGTVLLLNGKSRYVILEKPSEPEGLEYGAQRHDLEQAVKEHSSPLIVSKSQDSEWTNMNFMVAPSNGSLAVKENDISYVIPSLLVGLPEVSAVPNGSLRGVGIKVDEFACIDISHSVLKSNGKGANKQIKEAHMATSMIDELPCYLPNFKELHAKHSASADENLGVHETENPLITIAITKVEDDSMSWKLGNEASDMILGEDGSQVGLKKGRKEPFFVAGTSESIITEALDSQTSSLSKVCKEASCSTQGEEYASKQEHDLICSDEINFFKVVDMSKEQVIDYVIHSAAFQPPQTFEGLHVVEPPRSIYGKDMASDIDEVLEKLASEFERQESLSSLLP